MKVPLLAISVMIVFTACNREAKRDANGSAASNATVRTGEDSLTLSEKARSEGRDIKEGSKEAGSKVKEEARQAGRDIKEGANAAGAKVGEEARQVSRDVKRTFEGDNAATAKDKEIITRIRASWSKDAEAAKEADEIDIAVNKGAVILKGTVTSTDAKKEMARIAKKESGVTKVTDEIKIAERVGAGTAD